MILSDTAGASCAWMLFEQPPLLAQCVNLDMRLYYEAFQNLVYQLLRIRNWKLGVVDREVWRRKIGEARA